MFWLRTFFLHENGEVIDCRNPVKNLVICRLYYCFQVPMYTGRIVCTDGLLVIVDAHAHLYECACESECACVLQYFLLENQKNQILLNTKWCSIICSLSVIRWPRLISVTSFLNLDGSGFMGIVLWIYSMDQTF